MKRYNQMVAQGHSPIQAANAELSPEQVQHFSGLEQKYNLPQGYLRGMSWVESRYGAAHDRPGSQYKGMFQMGQHERNAYGVKNPADWRQSAEGAARLGAANKSQLERSLGRPVTGQELYIAHQQGLGGAKSLLSHPNSPAGSVANPKFIRSNHGNPNAPASQFTQKFAERYNQAPGGNGAQAPTQYAKNDVPTPPSRPGDLGQQPQQIARNDFGRGIPQSQMPTPGVGRQLDPSAPQTQLAALDRNDFGRGIPQSQMQTPGVGQRLEPTPHPTQMASNQPAPGSVLNRINPKDPSGPLLPEAGSQQMAQLNPNDMGKGIPASNMQTPGVGMMLEQAPAQSALASATSNAPLPPIRPDGLSPAPVQMADTPMPPSRPSSFGAPPAPVHMAQVHPQSGMNQMLAEPQGGQGGVEGFASGGNPQMAQMSPEMMNPQMMAGADQGGFGGLGGLFAEAFMPAEMPTQFADAGGMDFGGGGMDFGSGGFDLGSLFA